jgi:hypothetical protein
LFCLDSTSLVCLQCSTKCVVVRSCTGPPGLYQTFPKLMPAILGLTLFCFRMGIQSLLSASPFVLAPMASQHMKRSLWRLSWRSYLLQGNSQFSLINAAFLMSRTSDCTPLGSSRRIQSLSVCSIGSFTRMELLTHCCCLIPPSSSSSSVTGHLSSYSGVVV